MASFIKDIEEIRQRAIEKIEDGPVTASYKGDKDRSIAVLNEALATEIVCVLRYMHHYFMATGVHGRAVADEFKEHADEEREHADLIAERIQQLGGKPDFNPASLLQRSVSQYVEGETLADMIREDLIAERMVIEVYQEMIRFFGNNDPTTRRMIEHILAKEEEHAADLSDLLYIVDPETGKTEGRDPGTDPLSIEETGRQSRGSRGQTQAAEEDWEEEMEPVGQRARSPQNVRGRDREYDGRQEPNPEESASRKGQRGTAESVGITNRDRVAQREPSRTSGNAQASNTGGVSGRPMNRRHDIEDDDVAPRQPAARSDRGGMTGGTRSSKVIQKNRKNKRVA
jgi:bacterioferritin